MLVIIFLTFLIINRNFDSIFILFDTLFKYFVDLFIIIDIIEKG